MELHSAVPVRRPVTDVYGFWRKLENLPEFMAHLEQVVRTGERTSHWCASAPT